jgi:IS5 family transposase
MSIDAIPISQIEFDIFSRHEMVPILMALQHLYSNRVSAVQHICKLIREDIIDRQDERIGCTGLSYWEILVLASVRLGCNLDYDQLSDLADNHARLRQMMGLGYFDAKRYPRSTINGNITCLSIETLEAIADIIVQEGHRFCPKAIDRVRADSFVVQTNIHYPTDTNLISDGIRKIIELTVKIAQAHSIPGWRKHKYLLSIAKQTRRNIERAARSKQKNKEETLKELYRDLIDQARSTVDRSLDTIHILEQLKRIANEPLSEYFEGVKSELYYFIAGTEYVVELAERRVLKEESIPNAEKVFSLFVPETELINRGKRPYPIEFGHRVLIVQDSAGFIIHSHAMGNGFTDEKIITEVMSNLQTRYNGKILAASFDKGFWTPNNLKDLSEFIETPCLPKKGKRSQADTQREGSREFGKLRKWHPGVESAIHALGVGNGLVVCRDKDYDRYVALGVLGRNLHTLGAILMEMERLRKKNCQRAA